MAEVQISLVPSSEQGLKVLPDYLKILEEGKIIAEGPATNLLTLKISDLLSDFQLELHSGHVLSTFSIFLLPLLGNSSFSLSFFKDFESSQYFQGAGTEPAVKVQFTRLFEVDLKGFLDGGEGKRGFLGKESLGLGLELRMPGIGEDKKYLEGMVLGLSARYVQDEAREVFSFVEKGLNDLKPKGSTGVLNKLIKSVQGSNEVIRSQQEMIRNLELRLGGVGEGRVLSDRVGNEDQIIQDLKNHVLELEKKISLYENLEIINKDLQAQVNLLKSKAEEQDKGRQVLREEYEKAISDFQSSIQSLSVISSEDQDASLLSKLEASETQINNLQLTISSQFSELSRLHSELNLLKTENKFAFIYPTSHPTDSSNLIESAPQFLKDEKTASAHSHHLNTLIEKLKQTQKSLEEAEENCKHQEDIIKLISINSRVSATNQKLAQIPSFPDDLLKIQQELDQVKKVSTEFEQSFYTQSSGFLKKINKLSSLNLNLHRLIEKFVKIIQDKDCLIYSLRNIARDAALERRVYIPVKSDPVDICLADYLNNRKTPLQIPLIREDQGVYNFYTRTIKLKVQNNRIIVRLGGGFEGLDDFLNANTQPEVEKLEERRKFFFADSVKKLLETDFQVIGLPSVIDHLTPPLPNEVSFASNSNSSFFQAPSSPKSRKRPSILSKESSLKSLIRKKTMN